MLFPEFRKSNILKLDGSPHYSTPGYKMASSRRGGSGQSPWLLDDPGDGGAQDVRGNSGNIQLQSHAFGLGPLDVVKLVAEERDSDDGQTVPGRLVQTVQTAVAQKGPCVGVR